MSFDILVSVGLTITITEQADGSLRFDLENGSHKVGE